MAMELLVRGLSTLGLKLNPEHLVMFETYYRKLVSWNNRFNLTRITGYDEVQTKHFLDSLTVLSFWQPAFSEKVMDLGTGAGFPGIPLKILFPDLKVTLLEATGKKVLFLQHIIKALNLSEVDIVHARAEDKAHEPEYREKFDVVLARAVAELPVLVELALPFCKPGGRLIALKKGNIDEEVKSAEKTIFLLGGKLESIREIDLYGIPEKRFFVEVRKVDNTPEKYPRRSGMPHKRPLK